jgi:hypothetical protein
MRSFLSALIAYISSRIIFALFDFNHWSLGDAFDLVKLLIDIGVYAGLFFLFYWLLGRTKSSR